MRHPNVLFGRAVATELETGTAVLLSAATEKARIGLGDHMLMAALIFVISFAALIQFAALSWRAALLKVAAEPLPKEWELAADPMAKSFASNGFTGIAAYSKLCPNPGSGAGPKFRSLRIYYRFLQLCDGFSRVITRQNVSWTAREMALCTRCASVMLSRQLLQTQELSAAARSF